MNDILKRREISGRIARKEHIPIYRKLLKAADSPYAGYIEPNQKKLAVLLVSALLEHMGEEDILRATESPAESAKTAPTTEPAPTPSPAAAAVKKKPAQKPSSTQASTGMTWTTRWSGLRTLSTRTRSIWAAISQKLKTAWVTLKLRLTW